LRFTSLSSGSEGNALVVESGAASAADPTRVLIDCGLALKEMGRRLEERGLGYSDLSAIFVTHEHADHIQGVARVARAADVPVFLSHGTRIACPDAFWRGVQCIEIDIHTPITIGTLTLTPYPVPHDAREPTQVVIADGHHRLGVLTDTGKSTPHIEKMLSLTDALFLEANHDETLLENSAYPQSLKSRIAGPFGHLSNTASAGILQAIDQSRLQIVVAAHLSRHNNTPELVTEALAPALASSAVLNVASQIHGFDWIRLS
jgi:phosphoribosyl 1,2-cyclic phosphodiesterase